MIITNITPVSDAVSQQESLAVAPTRFLGSCPPESPRVSNEAIEWLFC